MTNLTVCEKRALEDIFICLENKKTNKLKCITQYLTFYKKSYFSQMKKVLPLIKIRRS
jgi:hypothetical protein